MLCRVCERSIHTSARLSPRYDRRTTHHVSLDGFSMSIRDGCFICRHLWLWMQENSGINDNDQKRIPQTLENFYLIAPDLRELGCDNQVLTYLSIVYGIPDVSIRLYLPGKQRGRRLALDRVLDSMQFADAGLSPAYTGDIIQLWHGWLRTCCETHTRCQEAEQQLQIFTPRRLVKLLPDDRGVISEWQIVHSTVPSIPYVTLSHCWGSSQPTRLTKETLSEFLRPSSVLSLPKTYQHATMIANSLNIRHLWIDSLCIVQDDNEDWKAQSRLMGLVYQKAVCNIAATWAVDSNSGCFTYRDPSIVRPCFITPNGSSSTYQIFNPSLYELDVTNAPLNSRGWVIQERYFTRRQLNFAKRQVYWECQELVASEQFPSGLPDQSRAQKPTLDLEDKIAICRAWNGLVESFSRCHLSHKSDKLYAVSGLTTELEKLTGDSCNAGLWKTNLSQQLCWYSCGFHKDRRTTQGRIAPTWSWANADGPICPDLLYEHEICDKDIVRWAEVIDIDENPVEEKEPLTNTVQQKIVLKGVALWGHIEASENVSEVDDVDGREIVFADPTGAPNLPRLSKIRARIYWDERNSITPDPNRYLFLFVADYTVEWGWMQGLVLRRLLVSVDASIEYVRVGSFRSEPLYVDELLFEIAARLNVTLTDVRKSMDPSNPKIVDLVDTITIV